MKVEVIKGSSASDEIASDDDDLSVVSEVEMRQSFVMQSSTFKTITRRKKILAQLPKN